MKRLLLIFLASVAFLAAGPAFQPLTFRGKPIFLLGNWDARMESNRCAIHPFLKGAGMNCVILPIDPHTERYATNLEVIRWFRDNHPDVAILVELPLNYVLDAIDRHTFRMLTPGQIAERKAKLTPVLQELRRYGNVLGYTLDELENRLYGTLGEWKKTKQLKEEDMDKALSMYMVEASQWFIELIHAAHPEAVYIPCQAWWTTYAQSDKLYDILIANEYPTSGEPSGYYGLPYDAQLAAAAAQKLGKRCFVYCPPGFASMGGRWKNRTYTQAEIRYFWFAPITFGAMGIMGWRQRRASNDYTNQVLLPVMLEISSLVPWLLGEPVDAEVTCARDQDMTKYKVRKRSRMAGKEDEEYFFREVKTISWIARRNPAEKSTLLLVANNSPEKQTSLFQFSPKIAGAYALELFSHHISGPGYGFKIELEPYSVKAFLITPKLVK
jgi:hypothetical protein